jgi:hypothetical protein
LGFERVDPNNAADLADFPERLKVVCHTCPFTCNIQEVAIPYIDSDDEKEHNTEKRDTEKENTEK